MTSSSLEPWRSRYGSGEETSVGDLRSARAIGPMDWVRILPTAFSEFDELGYRAPSRDRRVPPEKGTFNIDWKTIAKRSFFASGTGIYCDERVLVALSRFGLTGWSATPVPHASPNPVRGRRLYDLELQGRLGAPLSEMQKFPPRPPAPYGVAGTPIPPVTLDGSSWTGDAMCWSEWLETETISPFRALLVRGDLLTILAEECDGDLFLQAVEVVNLPHLSPPQRPSGVWQPAPRPWPRPSAWSGSVSERITVTAGGYRHFLPPPPPLDEFERVVAELEQRYGGKLNADLRAFMLASNGASLFAGMLTFLPIGVRTADNRVPDHIAGDDIVGAHERISDDDWRLKLDPGWILFAARYADFHALWAMNPEGLVRLHSQTGEVLGPELPFQAWFEDQVADLEWVWDNPEALGRDRPTWLEVAD